MMKKIFVLLSLIIISFLPLFTLAHGDNDYMMEGGEGYMMGNLMGWNNWGIGMGWFGGIFMVLFWGLIVWLVIVLIQRLTDQGKTRESSNSALDILKKRYAQGEIDKQEFEEKKKDLQ